MSNKMKNKGNKMSRSLARYYVNCDRIPYCENCHFADCEGRIDMYEAFIDGYTSAINTENTNVIEKKLVELKVGEYFKQYNSIYSPLYKVEAIHEDKVYASSNMTAQSRISIDVVYSYGMTFLDDNPCYYLKNKTKFG